MSSRRPSDHAIVKAWQACDLRIQFALFEEESDTELVSAFTNISTIRLEIRDGETGGGEVLLAPDPIPEAGLNAGLTINQWNSRTDQHGAFDLIGASLNLSVLYGIRKCWMTIYATTDDGGLILLYSCPFHLYRNRASALPTPYTGTLTEDGTGVLEEDGEGNLVTDA